MPAESLTYLEHSPLFPNPLTCLREAVSEGSGEFVRRMPLAWGDDLHLATRLAEFWGSVVSLAPDWGILLLPILVCAALTAMRVALGDMLKHIPELVKMDDESARKFPESVWKTLCYTVLCLWEVHIIFVAGKGEYFFNLRSHWEGWHPGLPMEASTYWLYMCETGLYYHLAVSTMYIDPIRKDFYVMMTHHVVAWFLIFFSYSFHVYKLGMLVMFIHDVGDIFLEGTKTIFYFRIQNGKKHFWPEFIANITFVIFTIQHVLLRIYWFLTKCIYSAAAVSFHVAPDWPCFIAFNCFLTTLFFMQVYWLRLMLSLILNKFVYGKSVEESSVYKDVNKETEAAVNKRKEE